MRSSEKTFNQLREEAESNPNWNSNTDIIENNLIDKSDLAVIVTNYGETDP